MADVNNSVLDAFAQLGTQQERQDMLIQAVAALGDDGLGDTLKDWSDQQRAANRADVQYDEATGLPITSDEVGRAEFEEAQLKDGEAATATVPDDAGSNAGQPGVPKGDGEVVQPTLKDTQLGSTTS